MKNLINMFQKVVLKYENMKICNWLSKNELFKTCDHISLTTWMSFSNIYSYILDIKRIKFVFKITNFKVNFELL